MLIFNCTKAAADFFSKNRTVNGKKTVEKIAEKSPHKTIAESESVFDSQLKEGAVRPWQWVVHALKVGRKTVVIVMDYHSRFSITLTGIKKGDHANFMAQFETHLKIHIWESFAAVNDDNNNIQEVIDDYFSTFNQCIFYARSDRSVQAHINDIAWHFSEYYSASPGYLPEGEEVLNFDFKLNALLRTTKNKPDYFHPDEEFLRRTLIEIGQVPSAIADGMIEQLKEIKRQEWDGRIAKMQAEELIQDDSCDIKQPVDSGNVVSLDKYRK